MPTLIPPVVLATATPGVNVPALAVTVPTIPANVLVFVDVENRHTTPASLGTVTCAGGTVGSLGAPEATVTEGGASPTRRFTRFRLMVTSDKLSEVITVTASGSQTGLGFTVIGFPGELPGGTNGSNAVRQTVTANSGGAAVTTLSPGPVLAAFGSTDNGVYVGFMSASTGLTPKTPYTELVDIAIVGSCGYESQYLLSNDTTPNATQTSNVLAAIASEIVAIPNPVPVNIGSSAVGSVQIFPPGGSISLSHMFRAGRLLLFHFYGTSSTSPGTTTFSVASGGWPAGLTAAPLIAIGNSQVFAVTVNGTSDISGSVLLDVSCATNDIKMWASEIVEVQNYDPTQGAGGVIQAVSTSTAGTLPMNLSPSAFAKLTNTAVLLASCSAPPATAPSVLASPAPGWKFLGEHYDGLSLHGVTAYSRPNAPTAFTSTSRGAGTLFIIEVAASPPASPVVTLVSPANGSTIAQAAAITINATDDDGDLTAVSITANGETVTAIGTSLSVPYSDGTISTITGPPAGKGFAFSRTGGFAVGALVVSGVATDSQNHTTPFSYVFAVQVVSQPPSPPGPSGPGDTGFVGGAALGCIPCFFSQQELLDLLDRLYPQSYLDPIKVPGSGYELYKGMARLWERVSLAVGHMECGQFILTESGGGSAFAPVVFHRQNAGAGAVIQKAGTVVSASKSGRRYVLQLDAAFGPTDLATSSAIVRAEAQGYEYNVRGQRVTARGEIVVGEIDTISLPLQDPPYGDPTIQVQQFLDASGGVPAQLDALGHDRGIDRTTGEPDAAYGTRIRALPDTVSLGAIRRLFGRLLAAYSGYQAQIIETWDVRLQTCWNAPAVLIPPLSGVSPPNNYDPNCFVWNDPRPLTPFRNRWLSGDFERAAFIVVLPLMQPIFDFGGVWNDTANSLADYVTSTGQRAVSAWNLPAGYRNALPWAWSGYDVGRAALFKGMWDVVQQTKAGCVAVDFELAGTT